MNVFEAIDRQLKRLHKEIADYNAQPPSYLIVEVHRLGKLLEDLARKELQQREGG